MKTTASQAPAKTTTIKSKRSIDVRQDADHSPETSDRSVEIKITHNESFAQSICLSREEAATLITKLLEYLSATRED